MYISTMKNRILKATLAIMAVVFAGIFTDANAQRQVIIEPGINLVESILGDTTAAGARVDVNTKYILRRGGFYLLMGSIDHRFPLTIEAEAGTGARPMLVPGVTSGGLADQPFRNRANLTLKGLHLSGMDELGGITLRVLRISAEGVSLVIDDCVIDMSSQAAFRFDSKDVSLYMSNSIVSNMGTTASRENGRIVDDRGVDIDSLVMINNTFYNITAQVIRDAGGNTNYARINGNTMVNVGMQTLELGPTKEAIIQNNLIINAGFYGIENSDDVNASIQVLPVDGSEHTVIVRNNNVYNDPALLGAYPGGIAPYVVYNSTVVAAMESAGTVASNTALAVAFTNGPATPTNVVTSFHINPAGVQPDMPMSESFDFGYSSSHAIYTGGTSGQPIGDRNWLSGVSTSIGTDSPDLAGSFRLLGNYPNPFNPTTMLRFEMPQAGSVSLEVYDALGRMVQQLDLGRYQAGMNVVNFNATNLPSGVYLARMISGSQVSSLKMTLIK